REQQAARALGVGRTAVLAQEAELPAQVLLEQLPLVRGRVHVRGTGTREEQEPPAGLPEAVRPVGLLAEEEERVVGRADLLDRLPPDEPHGAQQHLGLAYPLMVEAAPVERVQRPCAGRELAQVQELGREPPERRK